MASWLELFVRNLYNRLHTQSQWSETLQSFSQSVPVDTFLFSQLFELLHIVFEEICQTFI